MVRYMRRKKKNVSSEHDYQERSLMNSARPSIIGANSDITHDSKVLSVTLTGYTHLRDSKALRSQLRA